MRRRRRFLRAGLIAIAAYPVLLVLLSWQLEGLVEKRVQTQLGFTLRADEVSIDDIDVSLLRGEVIVRGLSARRTGIGVATLEMDTLELEIAPMGLALFDQGPRRLEVVGAHLDLSAAGAVTLQSSEQSREISVEEFIMRDSRLTLSVTSIFPALGQAELTIEKAKAEDVVLQNAMSWLYKTDELVAGLHLPGPMDFGVAYDEETLSVSGSLMGSRPITIPFVWPNPDPRELELSQILSLAKKLIVQLGPELAKRKAQGVWDDVVDSL